MDSGLVRGARERLEELLAQELPAIVYAEAIGPNGRVRDCFTAGGELQRLLGYTPQEWSLVWEERIHPEDKEKVLAAFERFWRGESGEVEFRYLAKDGRAVWARERARAVRRGEEVLVYGVLTDITSEVLARQALEAVLAAPQEEIIYVADPGSYEILYLNPAGKKLFGDPSGRKCHEGFQGRDSPCPFCTNELILREPGKAHVWLHRNERNGRYYRCTDRAIPWPDGRLVRFELAVDVTELMRAREVERRLEQAGRLEALGRLASGVAHDFNNVLSVIRGLAELAMAAGVPEELERDLREILRAGERAGLLTKQLLAFSRGQPLEKKRLDLNAVVRDCAQMLERILGEDISLELRLAGSLPAIHADAGQLVQVLVNLAANARDAMPGGGRLMIETSAIDLGQEYAAQHPGVDPGRYVLLCASDTGVGMSPEVLEHIFEPFFTTKAAGTGLGLAAVYGIVRQHDGHIYVYSEPGAGTTFKIYLPATDNPVVPEEKQERPVSGEGKAVLVAEDEPAVRAVAARMLRALGYRPVEVSSPGEALAAAQREKIDLALVDVVMPGMSGPELARRLRELHPGLPVVFTSGHIADHAALQEILDAGGTVLSKPYTRVELSLALERTLAGGAAG